METKTIRAFIDSGSMGVYKDLNLLYSQKNELIFHKWTKMKTKKTFSRTHGVLVIFHHQPNLINHQLTALTLFYIFAIKVFFNEYISHET